MKKALTALFAIAAVAAASAFAADKTDVPAPAVDNGARPPLEMGRGPLPQLPPHRPVLFSATVATDTPAETINKLTALIPASPAKHYEVHVEVVPVTGDADGQ
ncbi:hypothetical protein [Klebsiella variicola]|uniref:hypothetical protein n=1 Tax=Klebsiella variicola TaxID=244366 RepID=UPI001FA73A25|nr:hypothetical protein [Klebsiella variicola]MCI4448014.1 hypothetical protein [Klebsiella variicola]MDD9255699.1 hypothetical protein [Klebsiella variicola]